MKQTRLRKKEGNVLFNDTLQHILFMVIIHGKGPLRLAARVLLYASFHRQGSTYYSLCYTSRGALAGTRNSSMGPP